MRKKLTEKEIDAMIVHGHVGCEGCEYERKGKIEVDFRTGDRWKYGCPGTACANHPQGTPMNIDMGCESYEPKYQIDIFDMLGKEAL